MGVDNMTKETALNRFFNKLMRAYPDTAVPDDAEFPYLTYSVEDGCFDDTTSMTVQMWFKTESEAEPNAKARELKEMLKRGGSNIVFDNGSIWLQCGSPWCVNAEADTDKTIKLRQININMVHHDS
nr:MAG TPA: Protein of unknown function (DUF3168) [Caudoviricetes sp.]